MSIHNDYESKYGLTAKMVLRDLGGDPDKIINDYIATSSSCPDIFLDGWFAGLTKRSPEDDIHDMLQREIVRLYFASISRDAAVAICNVLGLYGTLSIHRDLPDLSYNGYTFAAAWSASNPNNDEIIPPAAMDI